MRFSDLGRYDLPEGIIQIWQGKLSDNILPLQERAVRKFGILEGKSVIISSPTSSGKTFIGELGALAAIFNDKKVIYLLPLKALIEEKYHEFTERYSSYGIKIVASSRDHRDSDKEIEKGGFQIAFIVYEKLAQLMISSPQMLKNVSLIVMDELQMLGDASRGAKLEVVLTQILRLDPRPQIIGLSAVLDRADNLAYWMKAELLYDEKRPTELLQGIFYNNLFRYRTYNTLETGEEKLAEVKLKDFKSVLLGNAGYFIDKREQILVFVKSKAETIELAKILTQRLALPAAGIALEELAGMEDTLLKDYLKETLHGSVAFHNANLTQAESSLVLRNFNLGGIRLICTTTTLAMGVNTPANTVFLEADFWEYFQKHEQAMLSPLSWPTYENISGRAGRLGYRDTPGRSILVASSQFEFDKYWRNYIESKDAGFIPQLNSDRLSDYVLLAIGLGDITKVDSVKEFFSSTYTGYLKREGFSTPGMKEDDLDKSLSFLEKNGFIKIHAEGGIILLSLGKVTTSKGISVLTALGILNFLRMKTSRDLSDLEVLYQALDLEDGRHVYIPMPGAEYWEKTYEVEIRDRLGGSRNLIPELREILERGQMAIYR